MNYGFPTLEKSVSSGIVIFVLSTGFVLKFELNNERPAVFFFDLQKRSSKSSLLFLSARYMTNECLKTYSARSF